MLIPVCLQGVAPVQSPPDDARWILVADFLKVQGPAHEKRVALIKELEESTSREWHGVLRSAMGKLMWHAHHKANCGNLPGNDNAVLRLGQSGTVVALRSAAL